MKTKAHAAAMARPSGKRRRITIMGLLKLLNLSLLPVGRGFFFTVFGSYFNHF